MTHKKIRIPRESANEIMRALGNMKNSIEFEDLTKDDIEAKKNFGEMIKRCDEMKKKIYDYTRICYDFHLPFQYYKTFEEYTKDLTIDLQKRDKKFGSTYFDLIENEIFENDRRINELVDSHTQIREDLVSLIEKKHVLLKAEELVRTNVDFSNFSEAEPGENGIKQGMGTNLNFMAGVVGSENEMKMKRMIFRISRGRAITAFYSLEINSDEQNLTSTVRQRGATLLTNQPGNLQKLSSLIQSKDVGTINTKKKIFTVVFTGSEENILLTKLLKVCEVFQASRYPIPKNSEVRTEINKIEQDIVDKRNLMASIEKNLQDFCLISNTFESKRGYKYSLYKLFFEQEKMIYTTLNKCIVRDTFVDGHVWIPTKEVKEVSTILQNLFKGEQENKTSAYLEDIPNNEDEDKPPTFIELNEFTSAFQSIVDTFGIPRYREINPGYFTIVTFPFLFGVMYGDIGHGSILLIFAIYLCIFNDKIAKSKSILKSILFTRYFLLLMGFFAVYCGLLYNDFLSIPLYFGSCYEQDKENSNDKIFKKKENCNYKFGLDPVWYMSNNELGYINSLKMKLSVILGVFHMIIGIFLKGLNAIFEKDFVELIFVFFPQLILMLILFGYMDVLIFVKWSTEYKTEYHIEQHNITYNENMVAPDIKSYLMNIFLNFGELPASPQIPIKDSEPYQLNWKLFGGEFDEHKKIEKIHIGILIGSLFCIILMFLPKLFINYAKAKKKYHTYRNGPIINNEEQQQFNENLVQKPVEQPVLSNYIVENAIETIEFVLGTVSNTASYLRLWALSLAHSQLAVVFFSKIIVFLGNNSSSWFANGFLLITAFPIFSGVTALVLLFMDLMECFLHTLRLHWVEFQNKFYKADGYQFKPFCFSRNLVLNDEEFSD
jgi:V-type H+-transporting ATPase subunit a